jgi:hypothetical protein
MPRHGHGLAMRTHGVRPSEKIAFRVISDLPPLGHLALDNPPRGGAGSARPQCGHHASPNVGFFGHHALANDPVTVTCPGLRPTRICKRTECAPPRKAPFASSGGLPARRPALRLASPRRGGLRTPARKTWPPPGHMPIRLKGPYRTIGL